METTQVSRYVPLFLTTLKQETIHRSNYLIEPECYERKHYSVLIAYIAKTITSILVLITLLLWLR